ncbi:hypothetical protein [Herpetosiphon geysericola]|uniref:Uncharacterized protein n=1 Tax=Herpetosiphon geysericola TaxID=70996 RepID=A0A0P6YS65_9CHLR|nr:hypothetical protein [Herpetosiphon geysericola]KPL86128.1 hypothetical protein SE18_14795 [Herpetosiphon geysericola]
METHAWYVELVAAVAVAQGWNLTAEEQTDLAELVADYSQQSAGNKQTKLSEITINLWHDYPTVQRALDPQHPQHEEALDQLYQQINHCLKQIHVFEVDALYLDERSPDLCAYADLTQKLSQFRFEARLSTYIYQVTWRAVLQWRRSTNALKRGGAGFKRQQASAAAQQVYYLSQAQQNQDFLLEDMLVAPDPAVDDLVAVRQLKREISHVVVRMHDDPLYAVAQRLWHELLFEQPNISALAETEGLAAGALFNLRARIGRRCRDVVERWCVGLDE